MEVLSSRALDESGAMQLCRARGDGLSVEKKQCSDALKSRSVIIEERRHGQSI